MTDFLLTHLQSSLTYVVLILYQRQQYFVRLSEMARLHRNFQNSSMSSKLMLYSTPTIKPRVFKYKCVDLCSGEFSKVDIL